MSKLRRLNQWVSRRGLNRLVGPVYNAVVATELAVERGRDRMVRSPSSFSDGGLSDQLTAVVKTFERPRILKRLIDSIRRFYPDLPIIVVDDSRSTVKLDGVETVVLPYDSGISAGRNAAVGHVKTPYTLMLDDDYIFYRHTRLQPVLDAMGTHPEIDLMGGARVDLPFFSCADYRKANLFPTGAQPNHPPGTLVGGFEVFDKVANFYVARTERLKQVGWDPALKRLDHADFFTRAKGVLTTVYNPDFKVLHAQNRFNQKYMKHRTDYAADQAVLRFKYGRNPSDSS